MSSYKLVTPKALCLVLEKTSAYHPNHGKGAIGRFKGRSI
jgi:hypothetical protein